VFAYLDNVTLYEYTSGTGARQHGADQHRRPARRADHHRHHLRPGGNLPGLLEVLVLSKLNLAQGSAYATTTLLSYTIVGVGFVSTCRPSG
jgi:potassium efflux system protein